MILEKINYLPFCSKLLKQKFYYLKQIVDQNKSENDKWWHRVVHITHDTTIKTIFCLYSSSIHIE